MEALLFFVTFTRHQVHAVCHFLELKVVRAPIAQLGEGLTLDHKVAGWILNRGAVLCP